MIHHIKKMKDKNPIAEKIFVKIQHPLMIRILSKVRVERTVKFSHNIDLNIILFT